MLFVRVVSTLVIGWIHASFCILFAPKSESLKQIPQLRRNVYKLGPTIFAEAALAIEPRNTMAANDIIQAIRALLRQHVLCQKWEAYATSEQLLQRRYLVVYAAILLYLYVAGRFWGSRDLELLLHRVERLSEDHIILIDKQLLIHYWINIIIVDI